MRHGQLTRAEAVEIAGEDMISALDKADCDYTGRLQTDGDDSVEFSASVSGTARDGESITVIAYYDQDPSDLTDDYGEGVDHSLLDWVVYGYEVI